MLVHDFHENCFIRGFCKTVGLGVVWGASEGFCFDPFFLVIGCHDDVHVAWGLKGPTKSNPHFWNGSKGRMGWTGMRSRSFGYVYRNHERPFLWSATIARSTKFFVQWRRLRSGRQQICGVLRGAQHLSQIGGPHTSKCRLTPCDT